MRHNGAARHSQCADSAAPHDQPRCRMPCHQGKPRCVAVSARTRHCNQESCFPCYAPWLCDPAPECAPTPALMCCAPGVSWTTSWLWPESAHWITQLTLSSCWMQEGLPSSRVVTSCLTAALHCCGCLAVYQGTLTYTLQWAAP
jgi:hypothetical protein